MKKANSKNLNKNLKLFYLDLLKLKVMNQAEGGARERIKKMIDIIYDEAHDKARKIKEQTTHQYNIEKNKILNQQKDKIIQDYKNKLEQYSVQRRM